MTAENPYYYGSAENKLNTKGQVAIPARFRAVLSEEDRGCGFVVVLGGGSCLYMYTHRQFARVKDNVRRLAEARDDGDFYRDFMADACPVDLDTQGRFVLPQALMREVGIKGPTVLFIGMDDRIEVWEPEVYRESRSKRERYKEQYRDSARDIFGI